jgi:K+-sensing histidine kinase KdpD
MQEHGGRIDCFNRPEGGATFVVEFPLEMEPIYAAEPPEAVASKST